MIEKDILVSRRKLSVSDLTLYIGAVVIIALFSLISSAVGKDFLNWTNVQNIIKQSSVIAVTAIGASIIILTGGIDLTVGSLVALIGILSGLMIKSGYPLAIVIVIALGIGLFVGLINGLLISFGKVPSFIVTLGMMQIARGLALVSNSGMPVSGLSTGTNLKNLMNFKLLNIPISIYYVFLLYAVVIIVMKYTRFGRRVYAIGGNKHAAKLAGVNVRRIETICYMLGGLFSAIGGIMLLSRLAYADPNAGGGYEMNAIASCVIGGISMSGGRGKIINTLVGALILGTMTSGLQILNVSSNWQTSITGIVIIAAVFADKAKERKAE